MFFGLVGENKVLKNEFYADFVGKVAESTVENPNVAKRTTGGPVGGSVTLLSPSNVPVEYDAIAYGQVKILDGILVNLATTNVNAMSQLLFSFNIIRNIEDKGVVIPGATLAEKIQWGKDNIASITCNAHVRGTSPTGNKASVTRWLGDQWDLVAVATNLTSSIAKVIKPTTSIATNIDGNGFSHYLAYAEPSDGVTASIIYTDKTDLLITLKPGVFLSS